MKTTITHEELATAAMPLSKLLREKGDPMMTILVTDCYVDLYGGIMGAPIPSADETTKQEGVE